MFNYLELLEHCSLWFVSIWSDSRKQTLPGKSSVSFYGSIPCRNARRITHSDPEGTAVFGVENRKPHYA
jgi:hypothetical protein